MDCNVYGKLVVVAVVAIMEVDVLMLDVMWFELESVYMYPPSLPLPSFEQSPVVLCLNLLNLAKC